jgi:glycosyltransferase involved in cell wall biosynthesis
MTSNKDLGVDESLDVPVDVWTDVPVGSNTVHVRYNSAVNAATWDRVLQEVRPDALHLNSLFSQDYTLLPLRRLRNKPHVRVVLAPRGMLGQAALSIKPFKKRAFLALARGMGWMDRVLWHASTDQEAYEVRCAFPRARVQVAQNLPSPMPDENPERPTDAWHIAVVGRVHRVKNLHFGLRALLRSEPVRRIRVDFIGPVEDAGYKEELEQLAQTNPAVEVAFLGGVPPSELPGHFQRAHYLLSATTQENFGHAIVEAWAHGCPVLISDRTPWRDLAEQGTGWDWPLEEAVWDAGLKAALNLDVPEWSALSEASRRFFSEAVTNPESERANLALFDL